MSIIKLTGSEMRQIANTGHSHSVDHQNVFAQLANAADEMAVSGMQGQAGPALSVKAAELRAKVDQHAATAQERFHGISQFADRTDQEEAERSSRIHAITSL